MDKDGNSIGAAVVGAGQWGRNLVRNFDGLGALAAVCDPDPARLEAAAAEYPRVHCLPDLDQVLGLDSVRAAAIASPSETHYRLAKKTLLAGKHVFVEKPFVLEEGEAVELIGLAREKGLTLMVGHILQHHPVFVRLKEMALSGELGRIHYVYSHRLNLGRIRREENILWSFAPHDISMLLALAGEEPSSVSAKGGNYLHERIADVTVTQMDFPSGLKAHIFVSWLHPFKEQKFVVVGDKRMAVFDDGRDWEDKLLLYPHRIRWENGRPVPDKAKAERPDRPIPRDEPLKRECAHFLACAARGETPITDGAEGLRVLRVLKAAQRSMDQGGAGVGLKRAASSSGAEEKGYFVHPTAEVEPGARIGPGVKIWGNSLVRDGARIGEGCVIGRNVEIGPGVRIGRGCKIQNNVSVYQGVGLEDEVFVGPSVVFTNVRDPRAFISRMDELRPTLVLKGASLGANSSIVCGNMVGRYAFVAAGAVLTANAPDHALMAGVPARRTGWVCECARRLNDDLVCPDCGLAYELKKDGNLARKG